MNIYHSFIMYSLLSDIPPIVTDLQQGRSQEFGKGGATPLKKGAIKTKKYNSTQKYPEFSLKLFEILSMHPPACPYGAGP